MKKLLILLLGVFAFVYLSPKDLFPSISQLKSYWNEIAPQFMIQSAGGITTTKQSGLESNLEKQQNANQATKQMTKQPTGKVSQKIAAPSPNSAQNSAASLTAISNTKYKPTVIQTYQVTVDNGNFVVTGTPTPYGQYYKANGVILYIEEPRANKKLTIKVPFNNGRINFKYPLTYTVGDVILNLDEYYNGKANDPNTVLGYAEYNLTDGDPYLEPSYMVQSNNPTLLTLAQHITAGKQTAAEKSRAIFEWVAKNIAYNAPLVNAVNPPIYSALQTYQTRDVLCTGYADLSAALHRAIGIDAKVVYGQNHAWNEIKLNGVWQTEDPTYGSGYIDANTNQFVFSYHPAYFYKSDKQEEGVYPW